LAVRPTTPPHLSDDVVRLRPWRHEDAAELVDACNGDQEMAYWLDRLPQPYTDNDAHDYVDFCAVGWRGEAVETSLCIADGETGKPLGSSGIFWNDPQAGVAEIGYWVSRRARGRGIATRAVRLWAAWALGDLGWERLELKADTRNAASCRVAERAGFTREGVIRSARENARDGERFDFALYSLLRAELEPLNATTA
jgi:ribosomal-protein-alanine N-acetyltransferase